MRPSGAPQNYESRGCFSNQCIGPIERAGITSASMDKIICSSQGNDPDQESERLFMVLADAAPVMIWMSDPDKLCTYFNKRWLDFTGRPAECQLGDGWLESIHPEDRQECMAT